MFLYLTKSRTFKSRRGIFVLGLLGLGLLACLGDAFLIEPRWIAVREIRVSENPTHRMAHLSDFHYKGDAGFVKKAVAMTNALRPDFVCITGDFVEEERYLEDCLSLVRTFEAPAYGVLGNHDPRSEAALAAFEDAFRATGGAWIYGAPSHTLDGRVFLVGTPARHLPESVDVMAQGAKKVLLSHYPNVVEGRLKPFPETRFDLILVGHSHGGQVRLPLWGPLVLPGGVGEYDRGLYRIDAGPLHVSPGLGTYLIPARFFCRPEISIIEF